MQHPVEDVIEQAHGVGQHVPGVEAQVAAQVNAERAQHQGQRRESPAGGGSQAAAHQRLHVDKRGVAQHQAVPGAAQYQGQIVPVGHAGPLVQVKQVGEQVRCVGEKQEPDGPHRQQQPRPQRPPAQGQQGAEHVGNQGQKQIPEQKQKTHLVAEQHPAQNQGQAQGQRGAQREQQRQAGAQVGSGSREHTRR